MRLVRFSRRTDVAGARGLALDYAKLRVMEALVPQWRRPVRLAGFTVHYTDLASLRWLFKEIFVHRDYEPPSGTEVRSIVDAGANVGLATLFFRDRYPDAEIMSFEPDPRAFACLTRNLETNSVRGVTAHNTGLGETRRTVTLYVNPRVVDSCQSISPTFAESLLDGEKPATVDIEIAPLADYVRGTVDVLKLDVEGSELATLRGAGDALERINRVYMEYHNVPEAPLHEVLQVLAAAGHHYELLAPVKPALGSVSSIASVRGPAPGWADVSTGDGRPRQDSNLRSSD